MSRQDYTQSRRAGGFVRKPTRAGVDYSQFATKEWSLLISFFRWYPDIMEDICVSDRPDYTNSLMGRVTKRYMARYTETFTYASRGYGKTSCIISDKCNKGILWPGEITGYYAPVSVQAAPLASKAFASYERNYPLLAAHWIRSNDAKTTFRLTTPAGSKFIMDIPRGIDTSGVVAEEAGQEDKNPFNFTDFNQIVLGTNRLQYMVNGTPDPTHIDNQIHYITSASRKENEAFMACEDMRRSMMDGKSAYALFIPWQVPVLCRMKSFNYYNMLRKKLSSEQFMRECETHCTGASENPIIKDSVLAASRKVKVMEDKHSGEPDAMYIIGYDVSSRDASGNALTAMSVIKCTRHFDTGKWDHYRKQLVYVMDMAPPKTAKAHAAIIKRRWADYSMDGGLATYVVIDARQYGQSVVEALHEDLGDGLPPLCTTTHEEPYNALEREGAVPCIYPIQATGNSGRDPNSEMLDYIEREFENGNFQLLTANLDEGMTAYKLKHGIKDDLENAKIQFPYLKTRELCRQVANLRKKYVSTGYIEAPIVERIPKDMWSATLYAARFAQRMEKEELYFLNRRKNDYADAYDAMQADRLSTTIQVKPRAIHRLGRMCMRP